MRDPPLGGSLSTRSPGSHRSEPVRPLDRAPRRQSDAELAGYADHHGITTVEMRSSTPQAGPTRFSEAAD
jgi:hypothetical protein